MACKELLPPDTLFSFEGYLALLVGQRVPTECVNLFDDQDLRDWQAFQEQIRQQVAQAVPVREGLGVVHSPDWQWIR